MNDCIKGNHFPASPMVNLVLLLLLLPSLLLAAQDNSIETVTNRGTLWVGMDIPYGVMEFYDKAGKPAGIDVDIAREIAGRLGTQVEFHTMPFARLFKALKSGQVDLILSAVTITSERQKNMRFSSPYMDAGLFIAVSEKTTNINSSADLKGKRVGVLKGTTGEKYARDSKDIDSSMIRTFDSNPARLQALARGEVDAVIVHFVTTKIPGVKIIGKPLTQSYYGIVGRLPDKALMEEVEAVVRELKRNGKLAGIKRSYSD
ncbi:MAG: amino acid ABC transporter substrate-binding protein [Gammaproteobacteria bacterium]|nr:amino acid ABC transporter substrate-binding protein [Gammaproteobacteria bacterium]